MTNSMIGPWLRRGWASLFLATLGATAASSAEVCATMGATQYVYQIRYCVTSVLEPQAGVEYGPQNLFDWDSETAWCEGVRGVGAGQKLSLFINDGGSFRRFFVMNGYGKSKASFNDNARPKTIEVSTDTGLRFRRALPDSPGENMVYMPDVGEYNELHIEIIDVYPGRLYKDTCLNEVLVDFEHEEMLFQEQQNQPAPPAQSPRSSDAPEEIEALPELSDF